MTRLRWGVLSTAHINRNVIPAIRASTRSVLVAVASRAMERARAYAGQWAISCAVGSYEALVDDRDIDAVYIPLPNSMHADWTVKALDAGKHVLCEKPLALTVEDVDRIEHAARQAGKIAAEAFMYRHHPLTHAVENTVRSGELGALRFVRGAFTFPLTRAGDVRLDATLGGGCLWDVGCYPVSYACLLAAAAPVEVVGWAQREAGDVDVDFAGMLRFEGGFAAQFDSGFRVPFRATMEVVGSDAVLHVEQPFKTGPDSRATLTRNGQAVALPFSPDPPYAGEIEDFVAAALDGCPQRVTLAESRRTVQTICALYESARTGQSIAMR